MTNITLIPAKQKLPDDFCSLLIELAERCRAGDIDSMVICLSSVKSGEYEFIFPSSLIDSLVLANLLHQKCVSKFNV